MPLIQFLIGGVQKGGTSALAQYLGDHPDVLLPGGKEAHVFDDPEFDEDWSAQRIDAQYRAHFPASTTSALHGDATPIYSFQPRLVARIARYNPAMKWIILLRDPIERAISHYYMERSRGLEQLPLWAALLAEPWRLHGRMQDLSLNSPLRCHSYCTRGFYSQQLDVLYGNFPGEQILLLRSKDLLADPTGCLRRVHTHLGLAPATQRTEPYQKVFSGSYAGGNKHRFVRWALGYLYRSELAELQRRYGLSLAH